jgi:hypothetical protein
MPWSNQTEEVQGGRARRYRMLERRQTMSWSAVLSGWRDRPDFRAYFAALLAQTPWPAFYWETPAVNAAGLEHEFEFVLIESRSLAGVEAEPEVFREYFPTSPARARQHATDGIAVFPNLGGDAVLVAPCPIGPDSIYAHLAAFCRQAPATQQQALWECVSLTLRQRLRRPEPVWLSTAGDGVSWLHVRLDNQPKYYNYASYRQAPPG